MAKIKMYPAEGYGTHIRSAEALSAEVEAVRQIAVAAGLGQAADNIIVVNEEADFDNQTATVITLTPGKYYQLGADITTNKRFVSSGAILHGLDSAAILTYLGSDPMFTVTNDRFTLNNITVDCPNATVVECIGDNTGNPSQRVNMETCAVLRCEKLLESNGVGAQIFDTISVLSVTGPEAITITSTTPALVLSFQKISLIGLTAGSVGIQLGTSTSTEIELGNLIMVGDSTATAISGLTNSGNITSGNLGMVSNCNFSALTTPLSGIDYEDVRWEFQGNAGVPDSIDDALIHTSGNVLETTIANTGERTKINAVFVVDALGRFTSDGTGRLTFVGERNARLPIDAAATILAALGGDKQVDLCVALNGTHIEASCIQGTASSTKATHLSAIWQLDFEPGDYIEIFIANDTNTINLIAQQAVLRIN